MIFEAGTPIKRYNHKRRCQYKKCTTIINPYRNSKYCSAHQLIAFVEVSDKLDKIVEEYKYLCQKKNNGRVLNKTELRNREVLKHKIKRLRSHLCEWDSVSVKRFGVYEKVGR